MGLNFHTADLDQGDSFRGVFASDKSSVVYDKQFSPYTESSSGFSISAGIIGKITNEFRLGASLESPTWWNIDRAYTQYSVSQDTHLSRQLISIMSVEISDLRQKLLSVQH